MLLLAQAAEGVAAGSITAEVVLFWVLGVLAVGSAVAVIALRNLVHAALMLVLNFLAIAGLYLSLESTFLSIIQVLVYAGAIMVLFLFVIMLLGADRDRLGLPSRRTVGLAVAGVALVSGTLLLGIVGPYTASVSVCGEGHRTVSSQAIACVGLADANAARDSGSVGLIGERLFTRYTYPFELAALLLTVATIGATVLGRRTDAPPDDEPDDVVADGPPSSADAPDVAPAVEADVDVEPATTGAATDEREV